MPVQKSTAGTTVSPKKGRYTTDKDIPRIVSPTVQEYNNIAVAQLKSTLNEFDKQVIKDSDQLRRYITNKLVLISNCGIQKDELKALELLGKISDIGLFAEKSEIKITHTTSAALEDTIKEKIGKLLAQKQPEPEEIADAEYEEVEDEEESEDEDA